MRRISGLSILASCLLIHAVPAFAQVSVGTFGTWNVNQGLTSTMNATIRQQTQPKLRRKPRPRINVQSKNTVQNGLTFRPQAEVSKRVRQRFLNNIRQVNPKAVGPLTTLFQRQSALSIFGKTVSPYGLQPNNLGDISSAYMVLMWMVANQSNIPQKDQISAVQQTMRPLIAKQFGRLNNAQRQETGEAMVYEILMALSAWDSTKGNVQRRQQLSDQAHRNLLKRGLDFRSLTLTSSGFQTR